MPSQYVMVCVIVAAETPAGYHDADPLNWSDGEFAVQHGVSIQNSACRYAYSVNDNSIATVITKLHIYVFWIILSKYRSFTNRQIFQVETDCVLFEVGSEF